MLSQKPARLAALGAFAFAAAASAHADGPTQTIRAGGVTFQAPEGWKSGKPSSTMRIAELRVAPARGDKEPAELVVYAFANRAGGGGSVEANIKRWEGQFADEKGNPPKAKAEKRKGKNAEVTVVDLSGRYVAAVRPGAAEKLDKPGYRLLGAIVQGKDAAYFFKMIGPEKTMKAAQAGFDDLVSSIEVEKD